MKNFNRTKIIATVGPATMDKKVLAQMMDAGVDVLRINASHGNHDFMQKIVDIVRTLNTEKNLHVALLLDLQGPKIRMGEIENGGCELKENEKFIITTALVPGNAEKATIQYAHFSNDVKKGDVVLIDDGKIKLEVKEVKPNGDVVTLVHHGGTLLSKKGVNLPYTKISIPSITEKDKADIAFALKNNLEWLGLSFVRNATDIKDLKNIIAA